MSFRSLIQLSRRQAFRSTGHLMPANTRAQLVQHTIPAFRCMSTAPPLSPAEQEKVERIKEMLASTEYCSKSVQNQVDIHKEFDANRRHATDTGSPEAQAAVFTARITYLRSHIKANPKDNNSKRGLLALLNKRRKILNYLNRKDPVKTKELMEQWGIRRLF